MSSHSSPRPPLHAGFTEVGQLDEEALHKMEILELQATMESVKPLVVRFELPYLALNRDLVVCLHDQVWIDLDMSSSDFTLQVGRLEELARKTGVVELAHAALLGINHHPHTPSSTTLSNVAEG